MVNWFAVYTHRGFEMKAAENLTRKGIENYCPVIKSFKKSGIQKKTSVEPLFPSFVYVRSEETELNKLKNASLIVNIMYWLQQPAVIKDIEIEMLKTFLKEYENIRLEKSEVRTNEIVKLVNEPYFEGNILIENHCQVKLELPSLGFSLFAVVDLGSEEIINQKRTAFLPRTDAKLALGIDY